MGVGGGGDRGASDGEPCGWFYDVGYLCPEALCRGLVRWAELEPAMVVVYVGAEFRNLDGAEGIMWFQGFGGGASGEVMVSCGGVLEYFRGGVVWAHIGV